MVNDNRDRDKYEVDSFSVTCIRDSYISLSAFSPV